MLCRPDYLAMVPADTMAELRALFTDSDNDGWYVGEDCDDLNPHAGPWGTEACENDIDDDCDGEVDEEDCELIDYEVNADLEPDPMKWSFDSQFCDGICSRSPEECKQISVMADGSEAWECRDIPCK